MPSADRMTTAPAIDAVEIEARYAPLGDYTVSFETFKQDTDAAPYFVGLPGDRCQCPHWGVVTEDQLTFRWSDHEETYVAGDAYYATPICLDDRKGGERQEAFMSGQGLGRGTVAGHHLIGARCPGR